MEGLAFSVAGLIVGTAVGATGVGGGSLMTPILILFFGISPALAVGTDLIYASMSKSYGVFLHYRRKTLDWRITGRLCLGSVPAAFLTLWWMDSVGLSEALDQIIKITLAAAVILTATFTLLQDVLLSRIKVLNGAGDWLAQRNFAATVMGGALIGAVVTISSVGAGVIGMMLLLILYRDTPPMRLVSADLAHAVIITAIAGAGHARMGTVDWHMLGWLLLGALPGIYLGSRVAFSLDAKALKRIISAILVLVGCMTLYKALA